MPVWVKYRCSADGENNYAQGKKSPFRDNRRDSRLQVLRAHQAPQEERGRGAGDGDPPRARLRDAHRPQGPHLK